MTEHAQRRVRAQYITRACSECRRRKIKCTGNEPCQSCEASQVICRYSHDGHRGRRRALEQERSKASNMANRSLLPRTPPPTAESNPTAPACSSSLIDELARMRAEKRATSPSFYRHTPGSDSISSQRQSHSIQHQNLHHPTPESPPPCKQSQDAPVPGGSETSSSPKSNAGTSTGGENWYGQGSALLVAPNRSLKTFSSSGDPPNDDMGLANSDDPALMQDFDTLLGKTASVPITCALANTTRLAPMIRLFFMDHNSCYYCLDPDPFILRLSHLLEAFSGNDGKVRIPSHRLDLIALAALASMILAYAEFLSTDSPSTSRDSPSTILTHQIWATEARRLLELYPKRSRSVDIVRFHLVATYYILAMDCISQEPVHGSSEAIAMAITSAYSVGLNNEAQWGHLSKDEKTSRRCLWASIDTMDKQVAYKYGRPYLIQEMEVAVNDLTADIKSLDQPSETGNARKETPRGGPADTAVAAANLFSLPNHLKLQYIQSLINITRVQERAWKSFFSVRGPSGCERDEVASIDALLQQIQRNFPVSLRWDTARFLSDGPKEMTSDTRIRLCLFGKTNVLRLAVHHAAIRGRKGEPPLAERYSAIEYQYTLSLCDDIACTTLEALFAYLNHSPPGSCLTTFVTSAALECIYHLVAIAQLAVTDSISSACQLSGRMIATLTEAATTFRMIASSGSFNHKLQLPRSILPLIEGILSQQKLSSQSFAVSRAATRLSSAAPSALPSLREQLSGNTSNYTSGLRSDAMLQDNNIPMEEMMLDFNAAYTFDPSLLPSTDVVNGRTFDFMWNDFFPSGYNLSMQDGASVLIDERSLAT